MQIAPDGKIYLSSLAFSQPYVSAINSPNLRVADSSQFSFTEEAVYTLKNGVGGLAIGLTKHIDAKALQDIPADFYIREVSCFTKRFLASTCCASSYSWSFGDGSTSSAMEPEHTYADTGTYSVTLIISGDTITKTVRVGLPAKDLTISGSRVFCSSKSRRGDRN